MAWLWHLLPCACVLLPWGKRGGRQCSRAASGSPWLRPPPDEVVEGAAARRDRRVEGHHPSGRKVAGDMPVQVVVQDSRRNNVGFGVETLTVCAMASDAQVGESVARRYAVLRPHLDERQRRLVLAAEAAELGRGGITVVAAGDRGASRHRRQGGAGTRGRRRSRRGGCGRPVVAANRPPRPIPGLAPALKALVDPETRGDPRSPLVWTTKSTRNLAEALTARRASGVGSDGGADAARAGVQPAGQRQGHRGPPARRPGRPVRLPQRRRSSSTWPPGRR